MFWQPVPRTQSAINLDLQFRLESSQFRLFARPSSMHWISMHWASMHFFQRRRVAFIRLKAIRRLIALLTKSDIGWDLSGDYPVESNIFDYTTSWLHYHLILLPVIEPAREIQSSISLSRILMIALFFFFQFFSLSLSLVIICGLSDRTERAIIMVCVCVLQKESTAFHLIETLWPQIN